MCTPVGMSLHAHNLKTTHPIWVTFSHKVESTFDSVLSMFIQIWIQIESAEFVSYFFINISYVVQIKIDSIEDCM